MRLSRCTAGDRTMRRVPTLKATFFFFFLARFNRKLVNIEYNLEMCGPATNISASYTVHSSFTYYLVACSFSCNIQYHEIFAIKYFDQVSGYSRLYTAQCIQM